MNLSEYAHELGLPYKMLSTLIEAGVVAVEDEYDLTVDEQSDLLAVVASFMREHGADAALNRLRARALTIEKHGMKAARRRPSRTVLPSPPPYIDIDDLESRITCIYRVMVWGESLDIKPRRPQTVGMQRLLMPIHRKERS